MMFYQDCPSGPQADTGKVISNVVGLLLSSIFDVIMASVRIIFLLYSVIGISYSEWDGYSRGDRYRHHGSHGVRRKVIVVRDREPTRRIHVTHEVRHVVERRPVYEDFDGSISIVRDGYHDTYDSRPEVVVVDHGGHDYIQPQPAVVAVETPVVAVAATPAVVAAPAGAVVPAANNYYPATSSSIDPR